MTSVRGDGSASSEASGSGSAAALAEIARLGQEAVPLATEDVAEALVLDAGRSFEELVHPREALERRHVHGRERFPADVLHQDPTGPGLHERGEAEGHQRDRLSEQERLSRDPARASRPSRRVRCRA